jgi:4-diphosphocytidyl-2-C-methyl-D-erythritol kinase
MRGPFAATLHGTSAADNLVLRAARELADRVESLTLGRFELRKRLPVAAGIGGGSADAAAALRLLARARGISLEDPRLFEAACAVGADVPVCLSATARRVRGIGEQLSTPLSLPRLPAVLVNPAAALVTKDVFAAYTRMSRDSEPRVAGRGALELSAIPPDPEKLLDFLRQHRNDLEQPATSLAPTIADALNALRAAPRCELARMSGSGPTCFGLFGSARAALAGARRLRASHPGWWICATTLG